MDDSKLADLLFPNITETPQDMEKRYPPRNLPPDAKVTRFAPSPTGFVHFGGMFPVTVGERLAHLSGGVFYLRIEDTDAKREVPGAKEGLIRTLAHYGIAFDEGADTTGDKGDYGPYTQSQRVPIYHVYAKDLVRRGLAYPVFSTKEELAALNAVDKKTEVKTKEWTPQEAEAEKAAMLARRHFTMEDVEAHLRAGDSFVLRMRADGDPEKRIKFTDLVKGTLEIPENDRDEVLLKSDGVPSYHFAHAVDDHLMGTTHVIRGEEWLPSLSRHLMLFRFLGFKAPKYMHIAQLMHLDENGSKKKLSKRDMGANMDDYEKMGYDPSCINEYVMTLLNSNYEEWHAQNPSLTWRDFPFSIKKMSASGCLFDFNKLNDVSRNVLSRMTADEVYSRLTAWAAKYDSAFAAELTADPAYTKSILAIGRGGKKPRKDFGVWSEVKAYMGFFYDSIFENLTPEPIDEKFQSADVSAALSAYLASYNEADDMNTWFEKIKTISDEIGFASDMKAYKAAPQSYKGSVADVSAFIRVAVTGRHNSPDLYTVVHLLGTRRTAARVEKQLRAL